MFVVEGDGLDVGALEAELEQLGDSLLVVGDENAIKVHVHTDDPGRALSLGVARGVVGGVEIAEHARADARARGAPAALVPGDQRASAVVAVAAGRRQSGALRVPGAVVVDGGETMNPSTAALVDAIEGVEAGDVVLLPNNKNVLMAAEQAADHSSKRVRVVPDASLQAGLVALVAFDPALGAEENAAAITEALSERRHGRGHRRLAATSA